MIELYQFPLSHYCEKIRWALDYKKLDYRQRNLLPGLHISTAKKLSSKSSLPILVHDGEIISGSSRIITYLDTIFPEHSLTPVDEEQKQSALEWEHFADNELGDHVRRVCYNSLLDQPQTVIPFFTKGGPWYGPLVVRFMFPKLRDKMRIYMHLNEEAVAESKARISTALDKIHIHLQGREFLTGDQFSRADLAVAALLAPLFKPEKYGLDWPEAYPDDLQNLVNDHTVRLAWMSALYKNYR